MLMLLPTVHHKRYLSPPIKIHLRIEGVQIVVYDDKNGYFQRKRYSGGDDWPSRMSKLTPKDREMTLSPKFSIGRKGFSHFVSGFLVLPVPSRRIFVHSQSRSSLASNNHSSKTKFNTFANSIKFLSSFQQPAGMEGEMIVWYYLRRGRGSKTICCIDESIILMKESLNELDAP